MEFKLRYQPDTGTFMLLRWNGQRWVWDQFYPEDDSYSPHPTMFLREQAVRNWLYNFGIHEEV